jgi:hypothetical protein
MAANTELLMALPYAAAFYFFMAACEEDRAARGALLSRSAGLILAGLLTGVAALFKQVGVLNLMFFAVYEVRAVLSPVRQGPHDRIWLMASIRRIVTHLSLIALGFVSVIAAFVLWLMSMGALNDFWRNGVVLSMSYSDSIPLGLWMKFMLGRGLGYVFFNAVLWSLAGWAVWRSLRKHKGDPNDPIEGIRTAQYASFDIAVAIWGAVSLVAVMMSGRFFGHYFIPMVPALSVLAARMRFSRRR